jgi:SPP1 family phage portal protein
MRFARNKTIPLFITNKDELSTADIITLMYEIELFDRKYNTNSDYYYGKHKILNRVFDDPSKPNNKIVVNIPKYITQVRTGYFSSAPMTIDSINDDYMEDVMDVLNYNDFKTIFSQLDTYCSIYGHAFLVLYLDDNKQIRIRPQKPTDWLIIYDNSLEQKPKFAIRYYAWFDDTENQQMYDIELWTDKEIVVYEGSPLALNEVSRRPHYFGQLPVIEFMENESRQGAYESVIDLIDAYELMLSDTANTVSYFSDCYLILEGMDQTDPADINQMKNNRVLLIPEGTHASFLQKNINETYNENLIKRLQEQIFVVACTPLLSDSSFSSNSSGVAIQFKLYSMEKSIQNKENIFNAGFNRMFAIIRTMLNMMGASYTDEDQILLTFTRSLPLDLTSLADSISKLRGVVSNKTLMSQLDFITDVKLEQERINEEKQSNLEWEKKRLDLEKDNNTNNNNPQLT